MNDNAASILTKNLPIGQKTTSKAPVAAPQNGPVRRVGSFTLGACLITVGILLLCYYFLPNFDLQLALKIAPAGGLILLGGEVLFFAAKPERRRYDFLSVLLCLFLMACCFALTLFPLLWEEIDPDNQKVAKNLSDNYQQAMYEKICKDTPDIRLKDMGCGLSLYRYHTDGEKLTVDNIKMLEVNFWLQGPYDSAEAFAKDCRRLTDEVQKMDVQPTQVGFYYQGFSDADSELLSDMLVQKANYTLYLNGEIQLDWTAAEMEKATDVESLLDEENTEDAESDAREEPVSTLNDEAENTDAAVESSHSDTN